MNRPPAKLPGIENRRGRRGEWTFRVRWKDPASGRRIGEEFDDQQDAVDFQAALRLARRSGRLPELSAGRELLSTFVEQQWWPTYALVELERSTQLSYASVGNLHALPRIGHLELRQVTPAVIAQLRQALEADGVGAPTIVKTLVMLQSVFRCAVLWGRCTSNPVGAVDKPTIHQGAVQPPPPRTVETIASHLDDDGRILVLLIAYAGLRPQEALALQWRHVRRRTLLVEQKNNNGEIVPCQKVRGRPPRTVDLLAPLAHDLAARRLALGGQLESAYVLARPDGLPWHETDFRNWRRRRWQPAAAAAGIATITIEEADGVRSRTYEGPRPYVLRHAFASLLLHEGRLSSAEIADQLGHSIATLHRTYAHVIAELKGQANVSATTQIQRARAELARRAAA